MIDPREKILSRERLAARWARKRSGRVVLANGLFDIVHVGHARYLRAAREAGDCLVVALNSDASARANRGPTRPLLPLAERMEIVAAFRAVDFVTWFEEVSVAETLALLRPEFHAKGTDYRPETLPEAEQALHRELGIQVVIAGDPKDHATTDIIRRVLEGH